VSKNLKNKKILHFITSLEKGGAEGALVRLIKQSRFEHKVICLKSSGYWNETLDRNKIEVLNLNINNVKTFLQGIRTANKFVKKYKPKVIQSWLYHADFFATLIYILNKNSQLFWNLRQTSLSFSGSSKSSLLIFLINIFLSRSFPYKIICCGESVKKFHENFFFPSKKLHVINNGFNLSQPKENIVHKQKEVFFVGMAARFDPQKNFDCLVEAFSIFSRKKKTKLILAGKDVFESNKVISTLIKKFNIEKKISLLGLQEDITNFYNSINIHLLISNYGEGFPNVVAESMSMGIPNIVSNIGESKFIIGNTGWLLESNDPLILASLMEKAYLEWKEDKIWDERCKRTAFRISENFNLDKMILSYEKAWS
tara:strand:- start:1669 stop:2775 length:1107 start_codon:yes stop_codon:yes gene_type:complete